MLAAVIFTMVADDRPAFDRHAAAEIVPDLAHTIDTGSQTSAFLRNLFQELDLQSFIRQVS